MVRDDDHSLAASDLPDVVRKIRARTPARLLVGRAGAAYRTNTQMDLREAHAAARDAVRAELDLESAFGAAFVEHWKLFEVRTRAVGKEEYLLRPDLGRQFDDESRAELQKNGPRDTDLQIAIGDGLSAPAIEAQVPPLLPLLFEGAKERGWKIGRPLAIHHCRVGILNEIGELLNPRVVVLLIGERPGLATADSLSAYMAYRPRAGHTDAERNLISNIHARGLHAEVAAKRILNLAARMMSADTSGFTLREEPQALEDCAIRPLRRHS
jgi:ethanolamine ammonia-lyase small subunit